LLDVATHAMLVAERFISTGVGSYTRLRGLLVCVCVGESEKYAMRARNKGRVLSEILRRH
jgi:hypothetical protein